MQSSLRPLFWICIALISLLLFAALGSIPLTSLNEGRRALVVQEMFQQQHWLIPTLNGELYLAKPPLLYWLALAISHVLGQVSELSLRLPSAIAAGLVLILTYRAGRQYFSPLVAILAMLLLAANLEFALLARRAEIEMLLTLFCFGAWLSFMQFIQQQTQRALLLSYLLLALAVMTKGPVALLFVSLPALVYGLLNRDKAVLAYFTNLPAWCLFILVAGTWYLLVSWQLGFDIWGAIIQHDMLDKVQSEASAKPVFSYLAWLLLDFYLLLFLLFWPKPNFYQQLKQHSAGKLLALGAIVPLLMFSSFANKHGKYLLPIYPLLALLLAWQISLIGQYGRQKFAQYVLALACILVAGLMLFYVLLEEQYFAYRFTALREFSVWHSQYPQVPMVSLSPLDSRLIFYAGKPIAQLDMPQLITRIQREPSILVLAEQTPITFDKSLAPCTMQNFQPYLKKSKTLYVYGLGQICAQGDK